MSIIGKIDAKKRRGEALGEAVEIDLGLFELFLRGSEVPAAGVAPASTCAILREARDLDGDAFGSCESELAKGYLREAVHSEGDGAVFSGEGGKREAVLPNGFDATDVGLGVIEGLHPADRPSFRSGADHDDEEDEECGARLYGAARWALPAFDVGDEEVSVAADLEREMLPFLKHDHFS